MSAETLPGGLWTREALAVERDRLATLIMNLMLKPYLSVTEWHIQRLCGDYEALSSEIAALGEVVMGPGDWRRVAVGRGEGGG